MSNVGGAPDPWEGRPGDRYRPPAGPRPDPGPPGPAGWDDRPGGWDDRPGGWNDRPGGWDDRPRAPYQSAENPYQPTDDPYPPAGTPYQPAGSPYEPPTQRYEHGGWDGGPPTYPAAQPGPGGYGQQPYPEPEPKRGRGPLIAVLAVLAVLVLGGAAAYWVSGRDEPGAGGTATGASADPTAEASEPGDPVATTPAPASSTDPRFVQAGQCVRNEGGTGQPKLVISECGAKTYQVLRRIDGATSGKKDAEAKCAKVAGYTDWYFFDSDLDTLDFVLCLKQR
ncbi:hypothetical protein LQ51_28565 [Micromonospora sp. HK10]|nr:hypothetical protein LQ51_28565 [Micromonospora sp. HK10]